MGRNQNPLIKTHFVRGEKIDNHSNRYAQTCRHCNRHFPKGRTEVCTAHLAKCPALSPRTRHDILSHHVGAQTMTNTPITTPATTGSTATTNNSDHIEPHTTHQNVALQHLANVASAAGMAEAINSMPSHHDQFIPLDPRLSGIANIHVPNYPALPSPLLSSLPPPPTTSSSSSSPEYAIASTMYNQPFFPTYTHDSISSNNSNPSNIATTVGYMYAYQNPTSL